MSASEKISAAVDKLDKATADLDANLKSLATTALAIKDQRDHLLNVMRDFVIGHDNGLGPDIERLREASKE